MGVRGHYTFSLTLDKGHFITEFYNLDRIIYDKAVIPIVLFSILDRLRSSVKLSCNQFFLDVFKVVDHTLPGLVSTAD